MTRDLAEAGREATVSALDTGPLRAASLTTQSYDRLRRAITEGALAEGYPLVIAQLVRSFGISHTPVREALARLHSEALVTFVDNVGYRVAGRPSEADVRHWMEARLPLEAACARLAAARITVEEIQLLRTLNARISNEARGNDFEAVRLFADLNANFHRVMVAASRNPFLQRAHEQIWLGAHFSRARLRRKTDHQQIIAEHSSIIAALVHADSDAAAAAMERHIVDSLERDCPRPEPGPEHATGEAANTGRSSRRSR
jgi:DNA-binding GntR family transcriptional regulator